MAVLQIPTDLTSLYYQETTQLEGVEYVFQFYWSAREGCWYLNLLDQDENLIAVGIKLVVSWPLLRRFIDPRLPPGLLYCADMTGGGLDVVAPTDFGTRVLLFYITSDDPSLVGVNIQAPL